MKAKKKGKKGSGVRLLCLAAFFVFWMIAIVWKLAWLQVTRHEYYSARAENQRTDSVQISPLRGSITDRNGQSLGESNLTESLFVSKREIKDPEKVSRTLAPLLGLSESELIQKLTSSTGGSFWLRRKLDHENARVISAAITQHKLSGVHFVQEPQRYYPHKSLAAHLLGFVNIDEEGQAGVELVQDKNLRGKPGRAIFETDGRRQPVNFQDVPAVNGPRLETTIDATLQHQVETIIERARNTTKARSVSAIVLDPQTGEIIALANAPDFDPNVRPKRSGDKEEETVRRNRAITDVYEPGSVFKIVTYSGVIEEGLVKPDDKVDCQGGQITIYGRTIRDSHLGTGVVTVADALAKSSNIGAIKMAQKLGEERLAKYVSLFGFGQKTKVDLPGEVSGLVNPLKRWSGTSYASIAMGHEVGVTALQAVTAMATIANGGVRVQPHVVRRVIAEDGRVMLETKPETQRVITEQTARTLTGMLEDVVTRGTATRIRLAGYKVAGKTGTAQKVLESGGYSNTRFVASFAGFIPATNPRFAIIVVLDEPVGLHQGGQVAAPIFAEIAEAAISAYLVKPDSEEYQRQIAAVQEKARTEAKAEPKPETAKSTATPEPQPKKAAAQPQPTVAVAAKKPEAKNAEPARPKSEVAVAATPQRLVNTSFPSGANGTMPDLRGRSLRAATQACAGLDLKLKVVGSGTVARQSPAPGTRVRPGEVCRVELQ
ncbi:MAG: penicillin-binding transpeptidase domain-containing protein [Blastocatellia bacterium]